ncbi:MAG: family 10 glycosylhydrolase, partial [Cyanobacteria bacterium P01_A01_bin.17]
MASQKKEPQGCGCGSIPFSVILLFLGVGYWWFSQPQNREISRYVPPDQTLTLPVLDLTVNLNPSTPAVLPVPTPLSTAILPATDPPEIEKAPETITAKPLQERDQPQSPWYQKEMRGIYLSRYQVTNNASEETIRERVRYYRSQGFNIILHGVWGNACTMYKSKVMAKKLGYDSCPNKFQAQWLDWLIDEAHKQDMQVHAYFEKGIKIDKNSPLFDLAMSQKWTVPGIDRTYSNVEHHVLDVANPEVSDFFRDILA